MCWIGVYPPGVQPRREHLDEARRVNGDGAGFAIVGDGYLITQRDLNTEAITDLFMLARKAYRKHVAVIHYRLATAKKSALEHVHPFSVGADMSTVLFHNGSIPSLERPGRSDSRVLAEDVLTIPERDYLGADFGDLEALVGPYGKAVILTTREQYDGECLIVNRGQWLTNLDGSLFSNPDHLGQDRGWQADVIDGELCRWNVLMPGQCARCHLFGCSQDGTCTPAAALMPRWRNETKRMEALT